MDWDRRDLIANLFAEAAALLERCHKMACDGQDQSLDYENLSQLAQALETESDRIHALAGAIKAIVDNLADEEAN